MQQKAEQGADEEALASYPVRPPGSLPSFASISKLPRDERIVPLEAWVAWTNANRGRMNPGLERELDDMLGKLEAVDVSDSDFERLGNLFDKWLDAVDDTYPS